MLGISVDSAAVQRAFSASLGSLPYPLLADFHPKGQASAAYGLYNEERGTSRRAIVIVDKEGNVRFAQVYTQGLPEAKDMLAEVEKLQG